MKGFVSDRQYRRPAALTYRGDKYEHDRSMLQGGPFSAVDQKRGHNRRRRNDSKSQRSSKSIETSSPNPSVRDQSNNEVIDTSGNNTTTVDLKPISGFNYDADDEDTRDITSMKIDVINVPNDPKPSIIKRQLKETLFKNMDKVIDDSSVSKSTKQNLRAKLHNIIEKDLDKSSLARKEDIDNFKQEAIHDINTVLDEIPEPDDKIKNLKQNLADVLNQAVQESVLQNFVTTNERLSRDLDNVIKSLRISLVEKNDLKDRIASMLSGNKTLQSNTEDTRQSKTYDGGYSFQENFVPPQHSTLNTESPRRESTSAQSAATEYRRASRNSQSPSEHAESEYTQQIKNAIINWMDKSAISLEYKDKEILTKGLTKDIVDRKKFLQINPRGPPAKEEELDQLKYQLYRRLNKMAEVEDLPPIIEKTDKLLEKIREVKVPLMIVPPGFFPREDSDTEKERRKSARISQMITNLKAPLYEDITNILDKLNVHGKERTALEAELMNTLQDLAVKGGDTETIKKGVMEKLRHMTNMTEDEEARLIQQLGNKALTPEAQDDFYGKSPTPQKERRKSARVSEVITYLKAPSYEDVANILDMHNATREDKHALQIELLNTLEDLIAKGVDTEAIKKAIVEKIRRMTNMTEDEAAQLTQQLIDTAKGTASTPEAQATSYSKSPTTTFPTSRQGADSLDNNITDNVNDWIATLPITINTTNEKKTFENTKKGFISKLKDIIPQGDVKAINKESKKFMLQVPLDPEMKQDQNILNVKADELTESLAFVAPKAKKRRYGMSFHGLSDFVGDWVDDINIDDNTKNAEEIRKMKKDIACDLIHKMGQMNVDPEIFNDISLYEDVLRDELNNLLEDVTITDKNFQSKKDDLFEKVKDAQHRAHDEIAGQTYKQQLRRTMSDILPDPQSLSPEEEATMKIMKDQLADAFINLHYSGNDANLKSKLKNTISNEINKFCKEYLKRHPNAPLDSKKLREDLYNALKRVPLPADDSMKYEVEQVRIRDEINNWIRELPLEPQTPAALLARNTMIYVLSKKLFDIEVEMDDTAGIPAMRKEIERFLKKMPLKPEENRNIGHFADILINKLKATELSRKFSESTITQIDDGDKIPRLGTTGQRGRGGDVTGGVKGRGVKGTGVIGGGVIGGGGTSGGTMCPYYKSLKEKQQIPSWRQSTQKQYEPYPCTLTSEDMAHLERIRERSCLTPNCISSLLRNKRHAGVGPQSMDAGSQTDLKPESFSSQTQSHQSSGNRQASRTCPGVPVIESNYQDRGTSDPFCQTDSRGEIQPQVIVKEYYWDTPEDENIQESELLAPNQQQQQQQNYAQRMPCDHSFPCSRPKPQRCSHYAQQKPCQMTQKRSSYGSLPCSRPPWTPSPCASRFAPNQQSTPLTPGPSRRSNEYKKRDGLQDQTQPTTSRPYRKERVIELGSLDDLCEPRPKKRNENFDWSYAKFPDEDNFWETPCMRRVILDEGIDEPLMMEREKREERVRCRCKERLVPKFNTSRSRTCNQSVFQTCNDDSGNLNKCSKCCGVHCPYPSYLYFR